MKEIDIFRFENGKKELKKDIVVFEKTLNIFINNEFTDTLTYSNGYEKELAVGYLFLEEHIDSIKDIVDFKLYNKEYSANFFVKIKRKEYKKKSFQRMQIRGEKLFDMMREMLSKSETFAKTGGTHISRLANEEKLLYYFEDISRKSTIQKCAGIILLSDINPQILFTSGRVLLYTVKYASKMKIQIIASQSAPSYLAIKEAQSSRITLIGFLRGSRFNIYSFPDSIL